MTVALWIILGLGLGFAVGFGAGVRFMSRNLHRVLAKLPRRALISVLKRTDDLRKGE